MVGYFLGGRAASSQRQQQAAQQEKDKACRRPEKKRRPQPPVAAGEKAARPRPPQAGGAAGEGSRARPSPCRRSPRQLAHARLGRSGCEKSLPHVGHLQQSRRGAVLRIELSSPRYHDLDDRGGYLGHLVIDEEAKGDGCPVQVVGAGTPAAKAGLKPGDRILEARRHAGPQRRRSGAGAGEDQARHGTVKLTVRRGGKEIDAARPRWAGGRWKSSARSGRAPATSQAGKSTPDAVHPQDNCPLSMLATLQQIGDEQAAGGGKGRGEPGRRAARRPLADGELGGRGGADQEHVAFRYVLPDRELEVTKTYRLAKVPEAKLSDADFRGYHLVFDLRIKNLASAGKARKLAYRLDGPNGLPDEGWWFASNTVSRSWGATGMRDVIVLVRTGGGTEQIGCPAIAAGKLDPNVRPEEIHLADVHRHGLPSTSPPC